MQWLKQDLQQYIQAKEYVDTVIVPLIPFQLSQDTNLAKNAFQGEVLSIFAKEIEKGLTGRILLAPNYYYLNSESKEKEISRLNAWTENIFTQPFKHLFFVTFDASWKKNEQALDGTLLWLPGIQSGDIQSKEMHSFIHDQVNQISELIKSYWA
ncbi:YpiF family protein [Lentibacillus sp. Marseille-P4043]|uniref:YpiF family protein n=1 Tax=Lentibacillus sp. Marseille-P4043 TaxID=2040293 RepID=UPI000D0BB398|nr:YpiF family protein [Lentibacillus sp. Marseille-P4043]